MLHISIFHFCGNPPPLLQSCIVYNSSAFMRKLQSLQFRKLSKAKLLGMHIFTCKHFHLISRYVIILPARAVVMSGNFMNYNVIVLANNVISLILFPFDISKINAMAIMISFKTVSVIFVSLLLVDYM